MTQKAQINRGELLTVWQKVNDKKQRVAIADLLGYQASAQYLNELYLSEKHLNEQALKKILSDKKQLRKNDDSQIEKQPEALTLAPPKPQVNYFYLAQQHRYANEAEVVENELKALDGVTTIDDKQLTNFWHTDGIAPTPPPPMATLTKISKMADFWQKHLQQTVGRKLDIKKLTQQIAKQSGISKLPTKARILPTRYITVIIDVNDRLLPFWDDFVQIGDHLQQKYGKLVLDMRVIFNGQPQNYYYPYLHWRNKQHDEKSWQDIPAHSAVVILSDLAQLTPKHSIERQHWLTFITQLNKRGITPMVLAPIAAVHQCAILHKKTQLFLWHRDTTPRVQPLAFNNTRHQQQVTRILAFLSLSPHCEPALLRDICQLLGKQEADSGVEADVYQHADVQWGYTAITLRKERREYYQQQFKNESPQLKMQVLSSIERHHKQQFAGVWAETLLNAEQLMAMNTLQQAEVKKAELLMKQITQNFNQQSGNESLRLFAKRHMARISEQQQQSKDYFAVMYALAEKSALEQGKAIDPLYQAHSKVINQIIKQAQPEAQHYNIIQHGTDLFIAIAKQYDESLINIEKPRYISSQCLETFSSLQKNIVINHQNQQLPAENSVLPLTIATQNNGQAITTLDTGQEIITLGCIQKPSWASEISMVAGELIATLIFAGKAYQLIPVTPEISEKAQQKKQTVTWQPKQATEVIGYDEFGLYATIEVNLVKQCLRYIEPGSFMMGSPSNEAERRGNETQHQVNLSQGFWLADTACTQALWQAVMGKNPSGFQNDIENPVEDVSWLDVQVFIQTINQKIPNLQAYLPSEAQWEYACRAGSTSPFAFGGNISTEQVNYDGNLPYADGDKGEYREQTIPVKALPANAWGLYQMHGNVWEWCFDEWTTDLGSETVTDPVTAAFEAAFSATVQTGIKPQAVKLLDASLLTNGKDEVVGRVLRGGSWYNFAKNCRSAFRLGDTASYRNRFNGFRFAVGLELTVAEPNGEPL